MRQARILNTGPMLLMPFVACCPNLDCEPVVLRHWQTRFTRKGDKGDIGNESVRNSSWTTVGRTLGGLINPAV